VNTACTGKPALDLPHSVEMQSQPVAVIVGASSGIGRETALLFAKNGVRVVVAARSKPNLDSLVKEINGDNEDGPQAIGVVCDITDFAQVKRVATKAYEMWGTFSFLLYVLLSSWSLVVFTSFKAVLPSSYS
jgi:NAD(P)-dependent dehydrogenase (short-subunit alcohol dehydrogenase family)